MPLSCVCSYDILNSYDSLALIVSAVGAVLSTTLSLIKSYRIQMRQRMQPDGPASVVVHNTLDSPGKAAEMNI